MKTLFVLLLTLVLWSAGSPRLLQAQDDTVSFELFYDTLEPYGEWVEIDGYGYCWQPFVAVSDPAWRPYADGWWSNTDAGWTWVSNEDFGWATYHYGRWTRLVGHGWVWVPGYEWAPAWVSWRHSTDQTYVGWAPLPPEAQFEMQIGFNTWVDDYYDLGPGCYNFVRYQDFGEPILRTVILPYDRNVTILSHSVNITHISYNERVVNNIYVGGPDYDFVRTRSAHEVRRLTLQRSRDFDYDRFRRNPREFSRSLNRREGSTFVVASPGIRRFRDDERKTPSRVREQIREVRFDRGWDRVKDVAEAEVIRTRMREDADRTRPTTLPPKSGPLAARERPGRPAGPDRGPSGAEGSRGDRTPDVAVRPAEADSARRMEAEREKERRARERDGAERSAAMMNEARERERREVAEAQKREETDRRNRMESEHARRAEAMRPQERRESAQDEPQSRDRGPRPGGAPRTSEAGEQQRQAMEAQRQQAEESRRRTMEEAQRNQAEEGRRRAVESQRRQNEEAQRRVEGQRRQAEEEGRRKAAQEAQGRRADDDRRRMMESQAQAQRENAQRAQQQRADESRREESRRQQMLRAPAPGRTGSPPQERPESARKSDDHKVGGGRERDREKKKD